MKNMKYIIINSFLIATGLIVLLCGIITSKNTDLSNILYGIGTSFIAGGIVSLIGILIDNSKTARFKKLSYWGLEEIFEKRSEINKECDAILEQNPREIEFIAFGLENFRSSTEQIFKNALKKKMSVKFLIPNPCSEFVREQEREENKTEESIKDAIINLHKWVYKLKRDFPNNDIEIRFYNAIPIFSYQRMDNIIYVGPNIFGKISQKAITFKFIGKSEGFIYFKSIFDELWYNEGFCHTIEYKDHDDKIYS